MLDTGVPKQHASSHPYSHLYSHPNVYVGEKFPLTLILSTKGYSHWPTCSFVTLYFCVQIHWYSLTEINLTLRAIVLSLYLE